MRNAFFIIIFAASIGAAHDGDSFVWERSLSLDLGLAGIQSEGHRERIMGDYVFEDTYSAGPTFGITYKPRGNHSLTIWASMYLLYDLEWGASFMYSSSKGSWGLGPTVGLGQTRYLWGLQGYWRCVGIRAYLGRDFIEYPDDEMGVKFINRTGLAIYYRLTLKRLSALFSGKRVK